MPISEEFELIDKQIDTKLPSFLTNDSVSSTAENHLLECYFEVLELFARENALKMH